MVSTSFLFFILYVQCIQNNRQRFVFYRAFDTELVVIAEMLNVPLGEVAVVWHEVDGSKLDGSKLQLALVSLGMLRDMICVRACYFLNIWKLN